MADDKDDLLGDIRAAISENAGGGDDGNSIRSDESSVGSSQGERVSDTGDRSRRNLPDGGVRSEDSAQRARDETGRFAKAEEGKARETLSIKEKPQGTTPSDGKVPDSTAVATTAPAATDAKPETIAPPTEWKGAGKVKWDRLPREIQSELRDVYQAASAERAEMAPLKELFDTNREFLVNQAGSIPAAMTQLMQFARMSVDNPQALIQHIARSTGINLAALSGQPSQGAPQTQPGPTADIAQLVQQQLEPILGQFRQQSLNQEISKIQAFRDDPKNPYFNDVAPRIEGLLKAGAAKDLQDAYDQAIWADPAIRQQLLGAQAEEAKRTHAAEVTRANQARAASLRGSPLPGAAVNGTGGQNSTVHDDVRAAMYAQE